MKGNFYENERVALFIDGANLYSAARALGFDIDYRRLAGECGAPAYVRVPTVGTHPLFIAGLADRVRAILSQPQVALCHGATAMPCGPQHLGCPLVSKAIAGGL